VACHLKINADPDAVPDFYLMRMRIGMRIQVTKMMRSMRIWIRIHIHNTDFKRPLEDVLSADFPLGDMFAVVFLYEVP
jgi:hypothetical protein